MRPTMRPCIAWARYTSRWGSRDAVGWFEKAVKANDKSSAHHLWLGNALGEQASHTNKLKLPFLARRVKGEFDKAVELDPRSWEARHGLIQFYSQAPGVMGGSMDKAKEQAREIGKIERDARTPRDGGATRARQGLRRRRARAQCRRRRRARQHLGYNSLGSFLASAETLRRARLGVRETPTREARRDQRASLDRV